MTVKELIEKLQGCKADALVYVDLDVDVVDVIDVEEDTDEEEVTVFLTLDL